MKKFIIVFSFNLLMANLTYAEDILLCESKYIVHSPNMTVKMYQQVFHEGIDQYRIVNKAGNFFSKISEVSRYTEKDEEGIQPLEYSYKQKLFGIGSSRTIKFDWASLIAETKKDDEPIEIQLSVGMLDPISYQVKLKNDLLIGADTLEYSFIKRGKVSFYTFEREAVTTLTIDKKTYKNVQPVVKVDIDTGERNTTVWLDVDQNHEILKIEKVKKGKKTTLERIKTTCIHRLK